jgi:enoyl-CoA hydratase
MNCPKTYETIAVERVDGVERITLNRPNKRNALSFKLQNELIDAVKTAEKSKQSRVIIIRGAGPAFCAGHDISPDSGETDLAPETVEEDVAMCIEIGERWGKIWNCAIPVIAQVHGYCVAGGTDLAMHCDLVIVADDAQIGFPPVRSQGGPPTHMWIYHMGPQWSKRMLLTGDLISGKQAAAAGFAVESVPAEDLDDHVMKLARRIASVGHDLLAHNKRIVNLGVEMMGRSQMQTLGAIHDVLGHLSPDAAEFNRRVADNGLKEALAERDAPFQS